MTVPRGWGYGIRWQLYSSEANWYERVTAALGGIRQDWLYNTRLLDSAYTSTLWTLDKTNSHAWESQVRFARLYPARFYLVLNEPDHPAQANLRPEMAAENLREFLRLTQMGRDFAVPGCELAAPGRDWFGEYLNRDGPLGTALHIHLHRARDGVQWADCLADDIAWLHDQGALWDKVARRYRPVIISETSANDRSIEAQIGVMDAAADAVCRGQVAAVYWYASYADWPWTNLLTLDAQWTRLGVHWLSCIPRISEHWIYMPVVLRSEASVGETA